ncbi:MAG TPA: OmpH family outer membrane protein [Pyrinomonadaceae bacterium]|nr:OmpH family outer membrane protein [Pyrinomonadaceae bacterium]
MSFSKLSSRDEVIRVPKSLMWLGVAVALAGASTWILWASATRATAQAVPTRIGMVDFQKILTESVHGKASVAKLTALQNDRLAKAKTLNDEMRKLDTDSKNPALAAAQRNAAQQKLADKQLEIKRFAEDADKEIGTTRDRELQSLQARLRPVIDSVGREMGMAAIFNKFESGMVYANDSIDLTNTVIVKFNATPAPPASPRD